MPRQTRPNMKPQQLQTPIRKTVSRVLPAKPGAPPVYRPQPPRGVMQRTIANNHSQPKPQPRPQPVAPPAYRPQPLPKVLQTKTAAVPGIVNQTKASLKAPPAYRPGPVPKVLQRKIVIAHHASPLKAVIQRAEAPPPGPPPAANNGPADAPQWDQRISAEARTAKAQLGQLDNACPSRKPSEEKNMAGRVKALLRQHRETLEKETQKFDPRTKDADKEAVRQLRYRTSWQIEKRIREQPSGDFQTLINDLKEAATPQPGAAARIVNPAHVQTVKGWVERCLALDKVHRKTESGKAKQINTANAKMMQEVETVLERCELTAADRQFFLDAKRRINGRIEDAAQSHGADFKSCDSAVIDVETQLRRAENREVTALTPPSNTETPTTTTTTL